MILYTGHHIHHSIKHPGIGGEELSRDGLYIICRFERSPNVSSLRVVIDLCELLYDGSARDAALDDHAAEHGLTRSLCRVNKVPDRSVGVRDSEQVIT